MSSKITALAALRNTPYILKNKVFYHKKPLSLELGGQLAEFQLAYSTYGKLNEARDNVIWVCHALTGNARVDDWWGGLFGVGNVLDPSRYFIVCANVLGSCYGSTCALSSDPQTANPYYHRFPELTIRDMVQGLELLAQHLGIHTVALGLGGSLGGQQLLEWAVMYPERFRQIVPIATNAWHSPWGIAFNEAQRMAIAADASWAESHAEAGKAGLKAARAMALLSYRNYHTYQQTQAEPQIPELPHTFRAASYQQYQGQKLCNRFDAFAYWTLSKAMDSHHLGRGRGSAEAALAKVKARALVIGIRSDLLFPPAEQQFLATHLPQAVYEEIDSAYGHDGFLLEYDHLRALLYKHQYWLPSNPLP
jgi:homoserine O-acetyltransferase